MFEIRQTRPVPLGGLGGSLAVHLVNWQDPPSTGCCCPAGPSGRSGPASVDADGAMFYMTNERAPEQGLRLPVGTLLRVKLDVGVIETIDDVINYSVHGGNPKMFYYRKHRPDAAQAELHLRDVDGQDRNLGLLTGQVAVPRARADVLHQRRGPGDDPGGRLRGRAEAAAQQGVALPAAPERAVRHHQRDRGGQGPDGRSST